MAAKLCTDWLRRRARLAPLDNAPRRTGVTIRLADPCRLIAGTLLVGTTCALTDLAPGYDFETLIEDQVR